MSQQGERPAGRHAQEGDWWGQLYESDTAAADTGPTPTADTVDDRFVSADAVTAPPTVPAPRETPGPLGPASGPYVDPAEGNVRRSEPSEGSAADPPSPPRPEPAPHTADPTPPTWPPPRTTPTTPAPPEAPAAPPAPPVPPVDPAPSGTQGPPAPEAPALSVPPVPPVPPPADPAPSAPQGPAAPEVPAAPPVPPVPPVDPASAKESVPERQPDVSSVEPPRVAPVVEYVGDGPPTYEAEPTALPGADPEDLDDLVADTVLEGARYGASTLRAVSVRGDSARYRGEPRRDSLLTARFGSGPTALILVAMATGARATPGAHRAAAEACEWIGRAVGLSHARLAEDVRAGRRGDLKSGLHRLTDRSLGKLRAGATEQGLDPDQYAATLRCLLLPADPACRTRVFFGVGGGGLFRLRDGAWQDIEPHVAEQSGAPVVGFGSSPPAETPDGDRLTMDLNITTPPSPYEPAPPPPRDAFRFRASVARPGDTLLLCSAGLAEPLRGEPDLARHLADRWSDAGPPGLAAFLADTQVRVKGYADDRTAAAVWEA
ncbi:protein phosphatase 2C domain-containing protein [Streptomyces sp. WG-D5]